MDTDYSPLFVNLKAFLMIEYQALYNATDEEQIIDIKKRVQVIGEILHVNWIFTPWQDLLQKPIISV